MTASLSVGITHLAAANCVVPSGTMTKTQTLDLTPGGVGQALRCT